MVEKIGNALGAGSVSAGAAGASVEAFAVCCCAEPPSITGLASPSKTVKIKAVRLLFKNSGLFTVIPYAAGLYGKFF